MWQSCVPTCWKYTVVCCHHGCHGDNRVRWSWWPLGRKMSLANLWNMQQRLGVTFFWNKSKILTIMTRTAGDGLSPDWAESTAALINCSWRLSSRLSVGGGGGGGEGGSGCEPSGVLHVYVRCVLRWPTHWARSIAPPTTPHWALTWKQSCGAAASAAQDDGFWDTNCGFSDKHRLVNTTVIISGALQNIVVFLEAGMLLVLCQIINKTAAHQCENVL